MTRALFARLLSCSLMLSVACGGDDPKEPTDDGTDDSSNDDADDEGDDEASDDKEGTIDAGSAGGKMDASKPAPDTKADAGDAGGGGSKADGGTKTDGAVVKPDSSTPPASNLKPKCMKKPTQLMVLGDSYINWITHSFPADIEKESGQKWRMEAIGAYSMGSGGVGLIGTQWDSSYMKDPDVHTILMDGGGNDLLVADPMYDAFGECKTDGAPKNAMCQKIIDVAIKAADDLLAKGTKAGVRDVIYFFYPHVPNGTLLGGPNPNAMLDYALPQVKKFCDGIEAKTNGVTRCHFVDMVPVFEGHDDWFVPGDIHETSEGSAAMAKTIWKLMKDKCIAQPASSGCCDDT